MLISLIELGLVILVIIALFNEDKLIAFEDKLGAAIGRGLRKFVKKIRS